MYSIYFIIFYARIFIIYFLFISIIYHARTRTGLYNMWWKMSDFWFLIFSFQLCLLVLTINVVHLKLNRLLAHSYIYTYIYILTHTHTHTHTHIYIYIYICMNLLTPPDKQDMTWGQVEFKRFEFRIFLFLDPVNISWLKSPVCSTIYPQLEGGYLNAYFS